MHGFDYTSVDDNNKVFWTIEEDGWFYNPDVRTIHIGDLVDGKVILTAEFRDGSSENGRTSIPLESLQNIASNFWHRRGTESVMNQYDISGYDADYQNALVRSYLSNTFFEDHLCLADKQARTWSEKYEIDNRAKRLGTTAAVAGVNVGAWAFTGPVLGLPISAATVGYGGYESYSSRREQIEARGWEQPSALEMTAIVTGDVTGINALRVMATGEEPLTGDKIAGIDRLETGLHLAVGAATAYGVYKYAPRLTANNIIRTRADFIVHPDGKTVPTPKTHFYVGPDGTTVPATAYRYMHSKYAIQTMASMSSPVLSYFGFEKINTASAAASRYQVLRPDWSNMRLRGAFDTLQLFDETGIINARVPMADGGRALFSEPFANYYPTSTHGAGGGQQLIPIVDKGVSFNELRLLREK